MGVAETNQDSGVAFSVIIPVYNRADQLQACIVSVRAQTFRDFELVIVDDGSTDGTCAGLATSKDLRVVRKANGGPASARNFGAEVATGRYLFFLDSDDLALPWALESFATVIARYEAPDIVCGNFVEFADVPPQIAPAEPHIVPYRDYLAAAEGGLYAAGGMVAVKREVFVESGGFDASMKVSEDHDLMLRLGERPGFVQVCSPPTYAKRDHPGSISKLLALLGPGCISLLDHFDSGQYGTSQRARRIAGGMVASHVRAAVVSLSRNGLLADSMALYRRAFALNARLGRWKFILLAPVVMARNALLGARR